MFKIISSDRRKQIAKLNADVVGFIINEKSKSWLTLNSNHWFAVGKVKPNFDCWFLLDSKLSKPQELGSDKHAIDYLSKLQSEKGDRVNILLVRTEAHRDSS